MPLCAPLVVTLAVAAAPGFPAAKLAALDRAVERAIAAGQMPGGVLWLESGGRRYVRAYGRRAVVPGEERMTADTVFDAASLTKVVATAPVVMKLVEGGRLGLDDPIGRHLPACDTEDKRAITVRHLLTHTSGLRPGLPLDPPWEGPEAAAALVCAGRPVAAPGELIRYSDVNFVLLGEIARRAGGRGLDELAADEIFGPLGMKDTGFRPPRPLWPRIAPTERVGAAVLRGVVHDPLARRAGGVAGHAGLFTSAGDLARFARMLLGGGALDGVRVLSPESVRLMTGVQTPAGLGERRGLGWDIDSAHSSPSGRHFPVGSFGHTGFTGTSIWIDPGSRTFVILLANRHHPGGGGNLVPLRHEIGTLAAEAAGVLGARRVLAGIDVLARQGFAPLRGLRVGLVTNQTGHDRRRTPTVDLLARAPGVKLVALFSPEHGLRGVRDEAIADSVDEQTGLPVYSLYGANRAPTPEQLRGLDALVYDVQDVGCRFYTYGTTLGLALEAAAKAGLRFFVLDRPNPIGGVAVEGPVMTSPPSFVGFHPLPLRHGLTLGELARLFDAERKIGARLTVIPVEGWRRAAWFDETGLPWTNPSPNMRTLAAAALYPGVGLLESALSVGRGTDTPFEVVGAPYIDDVALADELERAALPGVRFSPVRFTPTASVFKDQPCAGVRIAVIDRAAYQAVDVGLAIALAVDRLYPGRLDLRKIDRLLGHAATLDALRKGRSLEEIRRLWEPALGSFKARRARYLLYP